MSILESARHIRLALTILATDRAYLGVAIGVAVAFWIVFNVLDQLLFFSPFFDFYLPADAVLHFILSTVSAALLGLVASMNLFALRSRRNKAVWTGTSSFFSGTSIGVISGACASCTSLGFLLVSTFGATGALASSLLSNFQLPLRIISVVLLVWSLYSVSKTLTSSCRLPARRR